MAVFVFLLVADSASRRVSRLHDGWVQAADPGEVGGGCGGVDLGGGWGHAVHGGDGSGLLDVGCERAAEGRNRSESLARMLHGPMSWLAPDRLTMRHRSWDKASVTSGHSCFVKGSPTRRPLSLAMMLLMAGSMLPDGGRGVMLTSTKAEDEGASTTSSLGETNEKARGL